MDVRKDLTTKMFTEALFAIVANWKQLKCPVIEEEVNRFYLIIHDRISCSHYNMMAHNGSP